MSSKEALHIRMAEYDDIEAILGITSAAFVNYQKLSGASKLDALEENYDKVKKDIDTKLVFVAVLENEVAGCVRVELLSEENAYLTRFAVKPDIQNKGIGKALMNAVDTEMEKHLVKLLSLHTGAEVESLMNFYFGRGFSVESTESSRGYLRAKLIKKY